VWNTLPKLSLEELESICDALELQIAEDKRSKKSALYTAVAKHLMSDVMEELGEDQAMEVFGNVKSALDGIMHLRQVKLEEEQQQLGVTRGGFGLPSTSSIDSSNTATAETSAADTMTTNTVVESVQVREPINRSAAPANIASQFSQLAARNSAPRNRTEVTRFREFKIVGTVGLGFKDSLTYRSLLFEMQRGKKDYTPEEVRAAVIRNIKPQEPTKSLRDYLESKMDLTDTEFMDTLRTHYKVKESTAVLSEMSSTCQGPNESEVDFCMRLMGMEQQVIAMAAEEGHPIDRRWVRRTFYEAVSTGLRKETVRLQMQNTLRGAQVDYSLTDQALLKEIGFIVAKDKAHKEKTGGTRKVDSKEVDAGIRGTGGGGGSEEKNDDVSKILAALNKLTATQATQMKELTVKVNELSSVKDEMKELKSELSRCKSDKAECQQILKDVLNGNAQKKEWKFIKCDACARTGAYCNHCSKCGKGDHKRRDCRETPSLNS
jgi:hypothetical protein